MGNKDEKGQISLIFQPNLSSLVTWYKYKARMLPIKILSAENCARCVYLANVSTWQRLTVESVERRQLKKRDQPQSLVALWHLFLLSFLFYKRKKRTGRKWTRSKRSNGWWMWLLLSCYSSSTSLLDYSCWKSLARPMDCLFWYQDVEITSWSCVEAAIGNVPHVTSCLMF